MEKLIELLNEYDSSSGWKETDEGIDNIWKIYEFHSELQIISKKYGFIKWLVQENKIDFKKDALVSLASELGCTAYDEKIVLMVLSISDTPIEDLISYLK